MKTGGEGRGNSHDQSEIDIFRIFPAGRILNGLNRSVGVLVAALEKLLRNVFPETDQPASEREDEQNP